MAPDPLDFDPRSFAEDPDNATIDETRQALDWLAGALLGEDAPNFDEIDDGDLAAMFAEVEAALAVYEAAGIHDRTAAAALFFSGVEPAHVLMFNQRGVSGVGEMVAISKMVEHPEEFLLWSAAGFVNANDIDQAQHDGLDAWDVYEYRRRNVQGVRDIVGWWNDGFTPDRFPTPDCDCDGCEERREDIRAFLMRAATGTEDTK